MKLGVVARCLDFISPHNSMKAHKAIKIRRFINPPFYASSYISMKLNAKIVYELCRSWIYGIWIDQPSATSSLPKHFYLSQP